MAYNIEQGIAKFLKISKEYYLDRDGMIKPEPTREQVIENYPWVFFGKANSMPCFLRHALYFDAFGFIPEYCAKNCWKTIIKPYTLSDLFRVNDYLKESGVEAKCGIDARQFSFGIYLGAIYSKTHSEAKVKEDDASSTLVGLDVFTKKGCTEFENRLSSKYWNITDAQKEIEEKLCERIDHSWHSNFKQPDWQVDKIKTYWTQSAYAIGDKTWEESPYADKIQRSRKPARY